jgi:hypothetical protein
MTNPASNTALLVEDVIDNEDAKSEASTFCETNDHISSPHHNNASSNASNETSFNAAFSQDLTRILTAHINTFNNFPAAREPLAACEKLKFLVVLADYGKDTSVEEFDSLLEYIIRFATFERDVLGKI